MFTGHYSAGFAGKAADRAIPLWVLFVAVQLLDFVWSILVIAGIERVRIVPGFTAGSPLDLYDMPYTHSLTGALFLSAAGGALFCVLWKRSWTAGLIVGLAVFSHWILDLIVHAPDLLVHDSYKAGFGLWNYFWPELALEVALLFVTLLWYLRGVSSPVTTRRAWIFFALLAVCQCIIDSFGPPPAGATQAAVSALAAYTVLSSNRRLGRPRRSKAGRLTVMGESLFRNCLLAILLMVALVSAQTPAAAPVLAFEVASIKPAGPLDPVAISQGKVRIGMKVDGAICDIGSFSLRDLIRTAYEVKDYQIIGADFLGTAIGAQRFNIQATMPAGATEKQVPQMLQALLAERFKLVIHRETKDHSVYALVVAKGGPKLKDAEPDPPAPETPEEPKKGETVVGQGSSQVRISGSMENGKGMIVRGGPQGQMKMSMVDGKMHMEAAKMNMPTLVEVASRFVDRPVVDMTELKGSYQVALDLSMEDLKNVARAAGVSAPGLEPGKAGEASDPSGSSIFQSLQQMGLKLEARKAPLEAIVIDHLEKLPTEN